MCVYVCRNVSKYVCGNVSQNCESKYMSGNVIWYVRECESVCACEMCVGNELVYVCVCVKCV